jgi:hypothetical protein
MERTPTLFSPCIVQTHRELGPQAVRLVEQLANSGIPRHVSSALGLYLFDGLAEREDHIRFKRFEIIARDLGHGWGRGHSWWVGRRVAHVISGYHCHRGTWLGHVCFPQTCLNRSSQIWVILVIGDCDWGWCRPSSVFVGVGGTVDNGWLGGLGIRLRLVGDIPGMFGGCRGRADLLEGELNRTLELGIEEVAGVAVSAAVHARGMPVALVAAQAKYEHRERWAIYTYIRSILRESFEWQLSQTLTG